MRYIAIKAKDSDPWFVLPPCALTSAGKDHELVQFDDKLVCLTELQELARTRRELLQRAMLALRQFGQNPKRHRITLELSSEIEAALAAV